MKQHDNSLEIDGREVFHGVVELKLRHDLVNGRRSYYDNRSAGYRAQFYYDGQDWDAVFSFVTQDWVMPGQKIEALVWFLSPTKHRKKLYVGMQFYVREGSHVIADGQVIFLINGFQQQKAN